MKNTTLKIALFEKGITQKTLSEATGIPVSYLSMAITGKFNLSTKHQELIANYLDMKIKDLFKKPSILTRR